MGLILLPFMGREYMPTLKEGTLQLQVTMNANVSIEQSIAMGEEIEGRLMEMPGCERRPDPHRTGGGREPRSLRERPPYSHPDGPAPVGMAKDGVWRRSRMRSAMSWRIFPGSPSTSPSPSPTTWTS